MSPKEMYRVFNMGFGMAIVCAPNDAARLIKVIPEVRPIGEVIEQNGRTRVIIV
jgi:phosphoribosylaminoimidazole (AIR) synthetase